MKALVIVDVPTATCRSNKNLSITYTRRERHTQRPAHVSSAAIEYFRSRDARSEPAVRGKQSMPIWTSPSVADLVHSGVHDGMMPVGRSVA